MFFLLDWNGKSSWVDRDHLYTRYAEVKFYILKRFSRQKSLCHLQNVAWRHSCSIERDLKRFLCTWPACKNANFGFFTRAVPLFDRIALFKKSPALGKSDSTSTPQKIARNIRPPFSTIQRSSKVVVNYISLRVVLLLVENNVLGEFIKTQTWNSLLIQEV